VHGLFQAAYRLGEFGARYVCPWSEWRDRIDLLTQGLRGQPGACAGDVHGWPLGNHRL